MASNLRLGRSSGNPTMSERESAAGLTLAGNNTMSGRGLRNPTMDEREFQAGLTLAGNSTTDAEFFKQNFINYIENYIEQEASIIRQRSSRARRSEEKRIKEKYEEAIQTATNTRDKRQAKRAREEELENLKQEVQAARAAAMEDLENKVGTGDSIEQDSIDKTGSAPDNAKENASGGDNPPNTFTLNVVKSDNTAGTATFNGSGVN